MDFLKKLIFAAALIASSATLKLQAEYLAPLSCYYCCPEWNICNPCNFGCGEFYFRADLLYWRAREDGFARFAETGEGETINTFSADDEILSTVTFNDIKEHSLNFDWKKGFRVGVGYGFGCCAWDISTFWTHYRGSGSAEGSRLPPNSQFPVTSFADWKIKYDVVDIVIGAPKYSLFSCVDWKLFFGAKLAKIHQKLDAASSVFEFTSNVAPDGTTTSSFLLAELTERRMTYYGAGPEIGISADWCLGWGISLFGDLTGSILYNAYQVKLDDVFINTEITPTPFVSIAFEETSQHYRECQPVIDWSLGARWENHYCFCNTDLNVLLQLAWEHHQWFNHNKIGSNDDLCLDGVTFTGAIQF